MNVGGNLGAVVAERIFSKQSKQDLEPNRSLGNPPHLKPHFKCPLLHSNMGPTERDETKHGVFEVYAEISDKTQLSAKTSHKHLQWFLVQTGVL